jgi:hypothetical protein
MKDSTQGSCFGLIESFPPGITHSSPLTFSQQTESKVGKQPLTLFSGRFNRQCISFVTGVFFRGIHLQPIG